MNEETPPGTHLLSLTLPHHEQSIIYSLSGPNASSKCPSIHSITHSLFYSAFRLDSSTGILSLASPIDFEQQQIFVLKATAERKEEKEKSNPAVTTVVIEVSTVDEEMRLIDID